MCQRCTFWSSFSNWLACLKSEIVSSQHLWTCSLDLNLFYWGLSCRFSPIGSVEEGLRVVGELGLFVCCSLWWVEYCVSCIDCYRIGEYGSHWGLQYWSSCSAEVSNQKEQFLSLSVHRHRSLSSPLHLSTNPSLPASASHPQLDIWVQTHATLMSTFEVARNWIIYSR